MRQDTASLSQEFREGSVRFFILLSVVVLSVSPVAFAEELPASDTSSSTILPGFLGKLQHTFSGANFYGFYPRLGTISSGSGPSAGLRFWQPMIGGTNLDLEAIASISTKNYQLYSLRFGTIPSTGLDRLLENGETSRITKYKGFREQDGSWFYFADFRFQYLPQEDFYGIGPNSQKSNRTDYLREETSGNATIGYQWNRHTAAGVRIGYLESDLNPGKDTRYPNLEDIFDPQTIPGSASTIKHLRFTSALLLDYRDKPGNPQQGGLLYLDFTHFKDLGTGTYDFSRIQTDSRFYLPLGSSKHVIASRFATQFSMTPGQADSVPFYMLPSLGGSNTLRGFQSDRFRDRNAILFSAEYRWEATQLLEFAAFYDTGKVFPDISQLNLSGLENDYGIGIRLKLRDSVLLRFDTARSREGTRFYLKFSTSF